MTTTLYTFGNGKTTLPNGEPAHTLGGKGAGLATMSNLGLPIPAGLTIPTSYCDKYQHDGEGAKDALCAVLAKEALATLQTHVAKPLKYMPLLSVRSGARVSMPGMMDTILNVGLTTENLPAWSKRIGEVAALDSYRRLIQMYASTVDGIPASEFEEVLHMAMTKAKCSNENELDNKAMGWVVAGYKDLYTEAVGHAFPDTLQEQLAGCIGAVFGSWMNERAIEYRNANKIPHEWGTAVTVQSMVFGNMNDASGTGVLFTRDPNTGEPGLFGEFLVNAQGEDVVAGIRTPEPLSHMKKWNPKAYKQLTALAEQMEAHNRDMQDMEFTVQDGELFLLQTRNGKRSARAAFRIAYDLASAEVISWPEAVKRVTGKQYMALKRPTIAHGYAVKPTLTGLPAAGSVVTGTAVFSAAEAKAFKGACILVTEETTPDDFGGMMAAAGILTRTGGATSHAAVVARGMDKTCVVGASAMVIGKTIKAGDQVTLDGATGRVWVNEEVPVQAGGVTKEAAYIAQCACSAATSQTLRISLTVNEWPMQLPPSGLVVLDVRALAESARGRKHIRELLTELETRKGLRGVLEFNAGASTTHSEDVFFMSVMGIGGVSPPATAIDTAKVGQALEYAKWTKALTQRWVVSAPAPLVQVAKARGWKVARHAVSLGDLMEGGTLELSPALLARLTNEGVDLQDLLGLLKAAGRPVDSLPKALDEDTLMFAVLGK